jgi:hypothetical protein
MSDKADVRFYVEVHDSSGNAFGGSQYAHFTARCMILARESHGQSDATYPVALHSPDSYSIPGTARHLAGLEITAQMDESSREWYGWNVHYVRERVELRDAEEIVKVMRKITKRMDDIASQYGRPTDLGSFCGHAVAAIAGHGSVFMRSVKPENDCEGTGYRSMDVDSLRYHIEDETREWRKKHGIESE